MPYGWCVERAPVGCHTSWSILKVTPTPASTKITIIYKAVLLCASRKENGGERKAPFIDRNRPFCRPHAPMLPFVKNRPAVAAWVTRLEGRVSILHLLLPFYRPIPRTNLYPPASVASQAFFSHTSVIPQHFTTFKSNHGPSKWRERETTRTKEPTTNNQQPTDDRACVSSLVAASSDYIVRRPMGIVTCRLVGLHKCM